MITNADITKLKEVFATKEDFKVLRDGQDLMREKLTKLSLENFSLRYEIDALRAFSIRSEEMSEKILNMQSGAAISE